MYTRDDVLLRIESVTKSFGDKLVLGGIDIEIRDLHCSDRGRIVGQCVAVIGPSGSGKSTLLNIIAGLEAPTSGKVTLDGSTEQIKAGKVGVVFQGYPLFPNRTVIGNLCVSGKMGGLTSKQAKERAKEYLQQFDLADKEDSYPVELSGGQRQRIAIARQLILADGPNSPSTRLLLLDEPFSALDPARVTKTCRLIRSVADSDDKTTVMLVTHDLRAALSVADMILILKQVPSGGSRITRIIDNAESNMAWNQEANKTPEFMDLELELEALC